MSCGLRGLDCLGTDSNVQDGENQALALSKRSHVSLSTLKTSLADTPRELIITAEVPAALNSADAHWTRLNIVRYPSLREVRKLTQPSDDPESWWMMSKHKEAAIARHCGPMTVPTLPESSVGAISKTE